MKGKWSDGKVFSTGARARVRYVLSVSRRPRGQEAPPLGMYMSCVACRTKTIEIVYPNFT
jgi:hypothetical protein